MAIKFSRSWGSSCAFTSSIRARRDSSSAPRSSGLTQPFLAIRRQYDEGERAGKAGAHDAAGLNRRMPQQLTLDRSRRDILAFAGLELLFHAADDFHLTVWIEVN